MQTLFTLDEVITIQITPILNNIRTLYQHESKINHSSNLEESFKRIREIIENINTCIDDSTQSLASLDKFTNKEILQAMEANSVCKELLGILNSFIVLLSNLKEAIIANFNNDFNNTIMFTRNKLKNKFFI